MDRIFSIKKPRGMTSHDVVYKVRKILGTKKVGHTGTLDPDAQGVLTICVGRATKISDLILNKDKTYVAELELGVETDTYDSSGEILSKAKEDLIRNLTEEEIVDAINSQVGEIDQFPPVYSALKVNGKRMYELARSGRAEEILLVPRRVSIRNIDILSIEKPRVRFIVECSKGTYIRSICHDVGNILGVGAMMTDLIRTRSGIFSIDKSVSLDELEVFKEKGQLLECSYSIEEVLEELPFLILMDNAVKYYSNGGIIQSDRFLEYSYNALGIDDNSILVRVYSKDGFIGVGRLKKSVADPENNKFSNKEIFEIKSYKIFHNPIY